MKRTLRKLQEKIGIIIFILFALLVMIYVALLVADLFTVNSPNDHDWLY